MVFLIKHIHCPFCDKSYDRKVPNDPTWAVTCRFCSKQIPLEEPAENSDNAKSDYWWNEHVEEAIVDWLHSERNDIYLNTIRPALKSYAGYIISRYASSYYLYTTFEDLEGELITHASNALLNKYNMAYDNAYGFLHTCMRFYVQKQHKINRYQKRDYRLKISLEDIDVTHQEGYIGVTEKDYSYYEDQQFIRFACNWWRRNIASTFGIGKTFKTAQLILDIIENPINHITTKRTYSSYICDKMGISTELLSQICKRMRRQSDYIKKIYDLRAEAIDCAD